MDDGVKCKLEDKMCKKLVCGEKDGIVILEDLKKWFFISLFMSTKC